MWELIFLIAIALIGVGAGVWYWLSMEAYWRKVDKENKAISEQFKQNKHEKIN